MRTVLVDCRPEAAFAAGHVPGAGHAAPEWELSARPLDPADGGRHPLPATDHLVALFGSLGIDGDAFVLAYDEGTGWAARCWWLLRHLGHDACGTFDLRAYSGPLDAGTSTPVRPAVFTPRERVDDVVGAEELLARLDDPTLVLYDARSPERWRGDVEPLDPIAGRIPGARNAFFEDDAPIEVPPGAVPVAYCGSGVTACVVAQRLVLAGHDDVRMYPGSFSEWCRQGHPIERSRST